MGAQCFSASPLQLTTAVSRKTHGGAGDFDINLPLSGEPGVECRNSGGNHTLVFTFTRCSAGARAGADLPGTNRNRRPTHTPNETETRPFARTPERNSKKP